MRIAHLRPPLEIELNLVAEIAHIPQFDLGNWTAVFRINDLEHGPQAVVVRDIQLFRGRETVRPQIRYDNYFVLISAVQRIQTKIDVKRRLENHLGPIICKAHEIEIKIPP